MPPPEPSPPEVVNLVPWRVADPDNANKMKVSPDGSKVTSEGLEWKLNPFDEYAVETALR
jgi:electron transfer flavoprotein beta subunit